MPLRKDSKRQSDTEDSDPKTEEADSQTMNDQDYEDDEEDETQDAWLESLGIEDSEIQKINNSQVR